MTPTGSSVTPQLRARMAGVLYLIIFITAPTGAKDATLVKMIITLLCDTGVAVLFYGLFQPVNNTLSLFAAAFRLVFVVVMGANALNYFGYLNLFDSTRSAAAFDSGYGIALIPFGIHCIATGYLIYRSTFLPRVIGFVIALAGIGYLTFIWPPLADRLFIPYVVVLAVAGEGSLTLWLMLMGVNVDRWKPRSA